MVDLDTVFVMKVKGVKNKKKKNKEKKKQMYIL